MDKTLRIETALKRAVSKAIQHPCPPRLAQAIQYAMFPGGKRLRPRLALLAAEASGDDDPELADAVAAAVELLHCASLVQDDLPAFDDAPLRRGRATVHRAFDEPLAILVADALIVQAFEVVAAASARHPRRLPGIVRLLAGCVGAPNGITSGQAWESEPQADLGTYHRLKTGALFEAALVGGALAAGGRRRDWEGIGVLLGEAYQVADDLQDLLGSTAGSGKLGGRDAALGRPNAVARLGVDSAVTRLTGLVRDAANAVPHTPGGDDLRAWILDTLSTATRVEESA
ncbi:MAG: polyprenyl synthetase family protein [Deltaproteobacteria bacterium]|nr:polyprenyl synthetase family protein [Deltaproteobacteria bacterium]